MCFLSFWNSFCAFLVSYLSCWSPVLQHECVQLVLCAEERVRQPFWGGEPECCFVITSVSRLSTVCNAHISSFSAITVSVQMRFNCPETLQCFLSASFLYGNDHRKGLQRFSAAVLLVLLFCCSSECGAKQLQLGATENCECELPLEAAHLLNAGSLCFRANEGKFISLLSRRRRVEWLHLKVLSGVIHSSIKV